MKLLRNRFFTVVGGHDYQDLITHNRSNELLIARTVDNVVKVMTKNKIKIKKNKTVKI